MKSELRSPGIGAPQPYGESSKGSPNLPEPQKCRTFNDTSNPTRPHTLHTTSTAATMIRKQARERRDYLYRRALTLRDAELASKRASLKASLASGKPLNKDVADDESLRNDYKYDESRADRTAEEELGLDDEYAQLSGVVDPRILVTTSRDPSSRLGTFAKEVRLLLPTSIRLNRGNLILSNLVGSAQSSGLSDLVLLHEHRGTPTALTGTLWGTKTGQEMITDKSHSFTFPPRPNSKLLPPQRRPTRRHPQQRARHSLGILPTSYLRRLQHKARTARRSDPQAPVPATRRHGESRESSSHVSLALAPSIPGKANKEYRFKNIEDTIEVRHHVFVKTGYQAVELAEVGPRMSMRLFEIRAGTLDNKEGDVEWHLNQYTRTGRKKEYL